MAKYTVVCRDDGNIDYIFELLGEEFKYTVRPATAADREKYGDNAIMVNDEPCFVQRVRDAMPSFSERVYKLIATLDCAPNDVDACGILQEINRLMKCSQRRHDGIAYREFIPHFTCHSTATGPVFTGELKAADGIHSITYGGRTLVDAVKSFRRAVNKFIAFGFVA